MLEFNFLDVIFLVVLAFSTLLAFLKGFVAQALSLAGWVAAFVIARTFGEVVAPSLEPLLSDPGLQLAASYLLLALGVLVSAKLLSSLLSHGVQRIGLGKIDRFLGLVFGFLRGLAILVLGVAVVSLTDVREQAFWQESQLLPYMERVRDFSAQHLDAYIQEREQARELERELERKQEQNH